MKQPKAKPKTVSKKKPLSLRWIVLLIIGLVVAAGFVPVDARTVEGCPGSGIGSTRRLHLILGDSIDKAIEERPVYSSPDVGCPAGTHYKLYVL